MSSGRRRRRRTGRVGRGQSIYEWLILLLVAASPLAGVWLFGGVRLWSVGPLTLLVFLAGVLYFLRGPILKLDAQLCIPPAGVALLAFLAYAWAVVPRAAVPYDAHLEAMKLASYVLAYWIWTGLAGSHGRWRWLVAGLLLAVTLMAWYAIIQHAHGSRMVLNLVRPEAYEMRASGAYFCPNHFANLLEMTVPFALALALMPAAGLPLRLFAGYSIVVALPPLYLTQSRSGWIGLLAGLGVTLCVLGLRRSVRRFLVLLVVVPVALAALALLAWMLSPVIQHRIADALQGNVRLALWRDTLAMIADQPWLGFGPASYRWVYPHYWHHMKMYLDPEFAHNDYLQLTAEFGAIGAALLLGALLVGAARYLVLLRRGGDDRATGLIAGLAGAGAATAAHAAFDYNFHIYGNVQVLVMMAGITAGSLFAGGALAVRPLQGARRHALAALALVALLLALATARAVASYGFSLTADFRREVMQLDEAQAGYEIARRIHPSNWQPYRGLGHVHAIQAFWNRDPETRREQAAAGMAAFEGARARNPRDTESLFGMSRLYNAMGEPEQALAMLDLLVESVPHHRDFLVQRGLQLREMKRYEEALAVFRRARALQAGEQIDINIQFLEWKLSEGGTPTRP